MDNIVKAHNAKILLNDDKKDVEKKVATAGIRQHVPSPTNA